MDELYEEPSIGDQCIQNLPDEILDHIFSFLTIKERIRTEWVCSSWAEFGKNYKWSWPVRLDDEMIVNRLQTISDDILSSVLSRCGPSLKKLEMTVKFNGMYTSAKVFDIIGSNCRNLIEIMLDLSNKPEDENSEWSLVNVTRGCPKLEKFDVRLMDFMGNCDYAKTCHALKECRSLKHLELYRFKFYCPTFTAEGCLDAVKVPLKALYIWPVFSSNKFPVFAEKLLRRNDPLEELGFGVARNYCQDLKMNVVGHFEKTLKVLDLHGWYISSYKLCEMLATLKNLEVLSLKMCPLVDDQVMKILATNCKKLRALNIRYTKNVTDLGISALAALPNLTCLDLSETLNFFGKGLRQLLSQGRLEVFYFAGGVSCGHVPLTNSPNLVQKSCMELVSCSPNLRLLDLRFNDVITDMERLVDELRSSLQRGVIKGPVVLYLSSGQVTTKITSCEKLKLMIYSRELVSDRYGRCAYRVTMGEHERVIQVSTLGAGQESPWGRRAWCDSLDYSM